MANFDVSRLLELTDSRDVLELLQSYTSQFGFDKVFISSLTIPPETEITPVRINDWPDEYLEYRASTGADLIDPVIMMGLQSSQSFNWKEAQKYSQAAGLRLADVAAEFRLKEGMFIPARIPNLPSGCISIGGEKVELNQYEALDIEAAARKAYVRILEIKNVEESSLRELSNRQREVLSLAASDFKNEEIAEKLGISKDTVKFHMGKICEALNVKSRTGAVYKAVLSAQLSPNPAIRYHPSG